ncbi:MAG: hypothetical protein ABL879_14655 [Devosia sp.]
MRTGHSEPAPPDTGWWLKALQAFGVSGWGIVGLVQRGIGWIVAQRDALAARGADNIARQFHRLDRRSRFDDLDL